MRSTQRLARRSPRTPAVNLEQRHDRPRSSSWDVGPGARPGPAPAEPGTGSPCRRGDYSEGETTPLLGMRLGSRISLVGWPRSSSSVRGTHRSPSATSCHRAQRSTGVLEAPTHPTTHGSLTSTARRFDSSGHQVTRQDCCQAGGRHPTNGIAQPANADPIGHPSRVGDGRVSQSGARCGQAGRWWSGLGNSRQGTARHLDGPSAGPKITGHRRSRPGRPSTHPAP